MGKTPFLQAKTLSIYHDLKPSLSRTMSWLLLKIIISPDHGSKVCKNHLITMAKFMLSLRKKEPHQSITDWREIYVKMPKGS